MIPDMALILWLLTQTCKDCFNLKLKQKGLTIMDKEPIGFEGSYYQEVVDNDIITMFRPLLERAGYILRDQDGKIVATSSSMAWDTPWHHLVHDAFLDCQKWHRVLFDLFSRAMPSNKKFVPRPCQQCWKVVVRPKTLLGLFALMRLQVGLNRPSKCGIEIRPYVSGLYGGYFYNHSLQEGLDCYAIVRQAVNETTHLGEETGIILKRACTEFEKECGDSTKWTVSEKQLQIETQVNKWFARDNIMRQQPTHAIANVHRKWIEWAYSNGDDTYLAFTNDKPLFEPVQTYHHLLGASKQTRENALKKFKRQDFLGYDL